MNDIVTNKILLFALLICIANIMIFTFVPSSDYNFNLSLAASQPWRFFTFQFFHVDVYHLLENVIGLLFIAMVAIELNINFKLFLPVYILSVFAVFLPMTIAFPLSIVAGNSTGVYGVLALCLIKARKLVSSKITIPIIFAFMFSTSITNFALCGMCFLNFISGEIFHMTGFLAGAFTSFMPTSTPKRILKI
ncbi:MAG: rhomboid family intramembrane serine protease [Candidatus Aenigmatarchaeota archaeon]